MRRVFDKCHITQGDFSIQDALATSS